MENTPPPGGYSVALSVQPGPTGEPLVILHIGTTVINLAFALGNVETVETFRVELLKGLKSAVDEAKRMRLGLVVPGREQPLTIPSNTHG